MTTDTNKKPEVGMDAFFTRDIANEGIKVPLRLPDGTESGHWLIVYGVDSDQFRLAELWSRRQASTFVGMTDEERDVAQLDLTHRLRAKLVKAWSFDQECTEENVLAFFRKAPHLGDAVDRVASNRRLFFIEASARSTNTPDTNSGSTKSLPEGSNHAESSSSTSSDAEAAVQS